jgi:hypothetical protein
VWTNGGREVVWRLVCLDDLIVVTGSKSAGKLCHFPMEWGMGIDGADTSQQPNGEICMDMYGSTTVTPLPQSRRLEAEFMNVQFH